jgi:hypothetical protein
MYQTIEELARAWRHHIDIGFCESCEKGPVICVELPYCDRDVGVIEEYRCFDCAKAEMEFD